MLCRSSIPHSTRPAGPRRAAHTTTADNQCQRADKLTQQHTNNNNTQPQHTHTHTQPNNSDWTKQRIWKDTSQTAYISGLFLDGDRVLMSYGSSDIDARLLVLGMADLEGLFQRPFDCSGAEVVDAGSGEAPAPGPGEGEDGGGGDGGGGSEAARLRRLRRAQMPLKPEQQQQQHQQQQQQQQQEAKQP